jgi:cytochrome c
LGYLVFLTHLLSTSISFTNIMKRVLFLVFGVAVFAACNNSSEPAASKDSTASATPATVSPASEKGLELIGSSDCTTCHRLQKESTGASIGPAYSEVAAKYAPAADTTVDRLVQKIIKGGSGVWGAIPMTPHPALAPADVKTIVEYILSLKK